MQISYQDELIIALEEYVVNSPRVGEKRCVKPVESSSLLLGRRSFGPGHIALFLSEERRGTSALRGLREPMGGAFVPGAEGQSRTADTVIFSHVLYHLSYLGQPAQF